MTGSGMDRETFLNNFEEKVAPLLKNAYEQRGRKIQHLFIDTASIHTDERWEQLKASVKPYAQVHYMPASIHHLVSPLDAYLFKDIERLYCNYPNCTPAEVAAATAHAAHSIDVATVVAAIKKVGYYV